ncbi:MAG: glycosyltransferase family 39 protein [Chloroflexi bacterium]|nr:glycosyltransferase family 39 protein [Chloroflexota bacterium]
MNNDARRTAVHGRRVINSRLPKPALRQMWHYWPALIVLLFAFVLRAYRLDAQSIWFDEGWSWHLASLPLDQMAAVTAADRSPVLYYALLRGWMTLAGQSEFALRYLSLCADVVTVALVMLLVRRVSVAGSTGETVGWDGRRQSYIAGLLYALCPFAVWYAQETRMYSLVAMLCTASSYWLWDWLHHPQRVRSLAISAIWLALAVHTHYYAIFLLPAHGVAVFLLARKEAAKSQRQASAKDAFARPLVNDLKWLAAATCVVAVLIPWLLYASVGFAYDDGFVFPLNTIAGRMGEWVSAFASGGVGWSSLPEGGWLLSLAALAGIATYVFGRRWHALLFLAVLTVVPLLAATVAVRLVYPYRSVFHPRYLIYVAPVAIALIAGTAIHGIAKGAGRISNSMRLLASALYGISFIAISVLWLPALGANYTDVRVARDDVRAAVKHVVEALVPGDIVVMTRDNYAVRYYLQNDYPDRAGAFFAAPEGLHGVLSDDRGIVDLFNAQKPKRVRLFLWQDQVVDPQKLVESTLWAQGYEIGEIDFGQNRLPLYQVTQLPMHELSMSPVTVTFGGKLDLTAFWMRQVGVAGDWFYAVLAWTPRQKLAVDYKVFVHVWGASGQLVFQHDKRALNDLLPMSSWVPGQTLRDPYAMVIPANLHPGQYRVVVGVYAPPAEGSSVGGDRLPVQSSILQTQDNAVILGALQVKSR